MNRQRKAQEDEDRLARRYREDIRRVSGELSEAVNIVESATSADALHEAAVVLGQVAEVVANKYCLWLGYPKRRPYLDPETVIDDFLEAEETLLTGLDQYEQGMVVERASNIRAIAGKVRLQMTNFCERLAPLARIA